MATAEITYVPELRTICRHLASGAEIVTSAPVDNGGKGDAFSPTDLLATSLLCCMQTTIALEAQRKGFTPPVGMKGKVLKVMSAQAPRRVSKVLVDLEITAEGWDTATREQIVRVAQTCPVALSLHPDIVQELKIEFK